MSMRVQGDLYQPKVNFENPKQACQHIKGKFLEFMNPKGKNELEQIRSWIKDYVIHKLPDKRAWNQLLKVHHFCAGVIGPVKQDHSFTFRGKTVAADDLFLMFLKQQKINLEKILDRYPIDSCLLFFDFLFSRMKEEPSPSTNVKDYLKVCELAEIASRLNLRFVENQCYRKLKNEGQLKSDVEEILLKKVSKENFVFLSNLACHTGMEKLFDACREMLKTYSQVVRLEKTADGKYAVEGRWEQAGDATLWSFLNNLSKTGLWNSAKVHFVYSRHGDESTLADLSSGVSSPSSIGNLKVSPFIRLFPKNLGHLDLRGHVSLKDEELAYLVEQCPKIQRLTVGSTQLTEKGWLALSKLREIVHLEIEASEPEGWNIVKQMNISTLRPHWPLLKKVDVQIPHLGESCFTGIFKNFDSAGLEVSINISGNSSKNSLAVSGCEYFSKWLRGFTRITHLPGVTAKDLRDLSKQASRLRTLSFIPAESLYRQYFHDNGPLRFDEGENFPVLDSLTIFLNDWNADKGNAFTTQDLGILLKVCPVLTELKLYISGDVTRKMALEAVKVVLEASELKKIAINCENSVNSVISATV